MEAAFRLLRLLRSLQQPSGGLHHHVLHLGRLPLRRGRLISMIVGPKSESSPMIPALEWPMGRIMNYSTVMIRPMGRIMDFLGGKFKIFFSPILDQV